MSACHCNFHVSSLGTWLNKQGSVQSCVLCTQFWRSLPFIYVLLNNLSEVIALWKFCRSATCIGAGYIVCGDTKILNLLYSSNVRVNGSCMSHPGAQQSHMWGFKMNGVPLLYYWRRLQPLLARHRGTFHRITMLLVALLHSLCFT